MLGIADYERALGAFLLLAMNIVAINLSAKLVFLFMGIKPRTWLQARKARQSMTLYLFLWISLMGILVFATYLRFYAIT
jgi:uncharacterized membrane protein